MRKTSFFLLLLFSACVTVPGTNKSVFIVISPQEEAKMGEDAYRDLLKKEKISTNAHATAILKRVGARISAVAEARHHVGYHWEFTLIESKEMNAFCLPGGKVAFYTGILPALENEAAMAIVMGHEVAHATLRHGAQRMSRQYATAGLLAGLAVGSGFAIKDPRYRGVAIAALGAGALYGLTLPFSRANEAEADAWGLEYAAQAGYDPQEAVRFWQRFSKMTDSHGKQPALLSTHPSNDKRIEALSEEQAKVQPIYMQSPQYGIGEKI